jgi:signal transduction histidine kinase
MPRNFSPHSVPWLVVVALLFSTAIVLGSAYVARANILKVAAVTKELTDSGDTLDAAMRVRSSLHAMETGQRGYLLTGDKAYLVPYTRGAPVIGDLLAELKQLAADDQGQQRRIAALEKLVTEKVAELRSTIEAEDRGDHEGALRIVNSKRGFEAMEALISLLADIRADEVKQRATYKMLVQEQHRISELSEFVITAVVLSQLALCYFLLLRYLRQRRSAEANLAVLNDRLEEEVRGRTTELRDLSRYLMTIREEEKARIARELHDEMGSSLTAVNMDLMSVRQRLGEDSPLTSRLVRATGTLKSTVEAMRRIIEDLRPTMLESLGLREAVRSWATDYAGRVGVPLAIDIPEEMPPLPAGSPIGLFRIVQEALTNAVRHASASSIRVSIRVDKDDVVLEVVDDGVGIAPRAGSAGGTGGTSRSPHGLLGIRERANAMGGVATIGPGPDGRGTEVRVVVPVAKVRAPAAPAA